MTDATNPPIQVLGTVRAVASNVDLEIIRESSSGRIAWQYADSGCPACPSWPEWSELRRDPYVALGWVSYDDDGVPTWAGPGAESNSLEFEGDSDEYVMVRRDDLINALYGNDTNEARGRLWAALDRTPAGDAKE